MMKKLVILAVLALFLTGCAGEESPATEPTETTVPAPTGLLESESDVQSNTDGAVLRYRLPEENCYRILGVGDRLLLLSGAEQTTLSLYSGAECLPVGQVQLPVDLRQTVWQLTDTGFAYYDPQSRQVIYLDSQLQQMHSATMPEDMEGTPVIAPACDEVYYCVGQEIRGLDIERGISRLIKSHSGQSQRLTGCYLDGTVLSCVVEKQDGKVETVYFSAENGRTCSTDGGILWLESYEEQYLLSRVDGVTSQYITGSISGTPQQLNVPADTLAVMDAVALDGAVGYGRDAADAMTLAFYDLFTGQKTAQVATGMNVTPVSVWADRWSGCVWLLCQQENGGLLLRWDVKASQLAEETNYLGTVYTESTPDETGLAALQSRVDALNKQCGTEIRIWQNAIKTPGNYNLKPEYQVSAIGALLDQLEPVLQMFPENFLKKSVNTRIRICIVRSVDGERSAVRYWDDGDAYVVLPVGEDPQAAFLQAMGYILDSHILGNSAMLDAWEGLNPEGFAYGQDAAAYLEGEKRAFADPISSQSVTDDRAMLFYYAITADNQEIFQSPIMQEKLLLLCQSIRNAWRLEKKTDTYLWEQYLDQSIAYVK